LSASRSTSPPSTPARPPIDLARVGPDGGQKCCATLARDLSFGIRTRPGAVWIVIDEKGQPFGHFVVEDKPGNAARAVIPNVDGKP
jgi:hypothetical protein